MAPATTRATPADNSAHEAIASWFLGPKAENVKFLKEAFDFIVTDMQNSRQSYHPEDKVCFQFMLSVLITNGGLTRLCTGIRHRGRPRISSLPA